MYYTEYYNIILYSMILYIYIYILYTLTTNIKSNHPSLKELFEIVVSESTHRAEHVLASLCREQRGELFEPHLELFHSPVTELGIRATQRGSDGSSMLICAASLSRSRVLRA